MNCKKIINIILRCGIYVYILSRMFNLCPEIGPISFVSFITTLLGMILGDYLTYYKIDVADEITNSSANLTIMLNMIFLSYVYAKLCGLYKFFKNYKLWQRNLIFLLIILLVFPVAMFDFKNLKVFDNFFFENKQVTVIMTMFFAMIAFYLNLFFEFLTKKFPKPFEKIGYFFSIEFYKKIFKRKKLKKRNALF